MATTNYPHRESDMIVPRNDGIYSAIDIGNQVVLNAGTGGEHGYAPDNYRYVQEEIYLAQRPYCVVLSTPEAFSSIPGGDTLHAVIRNIMETRTRSFTGVSSQTTTEYVDVSWQGGQRLSVPAGATRQFGTISHTFFDLRGELPSKVIKIWQEYLLMDPTILHPKIITLDYSGDLLLDERAMACVYIEPTVNMKDVAHSCVSLAMMVRNGPQFEMSYNVDDTAQRSREITLEFTGLMDFDSVASKNIARACLKRLPLYSPDYMDAPEGFKKPTARLEGIGSGGIVEAMNNAAKRVVKRGYAS